MKAIIVIIGLSLVFVSCNKNDKINTANIYTDSKGTTLTITSSKWYTTITGNSINGFAGVNLSLAGSTNADEVLVETYGDGLIGFYPLALDMKKNFNDDSIGIQFNYYSGSKPTNQVETSTEIIAVKGIDTLITSLKSGILSY